MRFAHQYVPRFMLIYFCIVPLTLLLLNVLTIHNIRSMRQPLKSRVHSQLTLLILLETTVTAISILPQTAFMVYFQLTHHLRRSTTRRSIEHLLGAILKLVAYSECTLGLIIYLTSLSQLRRNVVRKLCSMVYPKWKDANPSSGMKKFRAIEMND